MGPKYSKQIEMWDDGYAQPADKSSENLKHVCGAVISFSTTATDTDYGAG
jgi:hypothetical protein